MPHDSSQTNAAPVDRWWLIALIAAVCAFVEVVLLWMWPTSIWIWALSVGLAVFAIIAWYHLTTWYRRIVSTLIGSGGAAGIAPSLLVHFQLSDKPILAILVESSPIVPVSCFLLAGWFARLDHRKDGGSTQQGIRKGKSSHALQQASGSTQVVGGSFYGPTTIQTGASDEALLRIIETHASERSDLQAQLSARDNTISELRSAVERVRRQADTGDGEAEAALVAARSSGDAAGILSVLENRADALLDRVESGTQELKNHTEEFIAVSREIAATAFLIGDIAKAESSAQAILKLLPNDLDAMNQLGLIHALRGELIAAEKHYQRVLNLSGSDANRAGVSMNLGIVYGTRGNLKQAEKMFTRALNSFKQLDQKEGMAGAYGNLGRICRIRGDLDLAEKMQQKALAQFEQLDCGEGMVACYTNLGVIYLIQEDPDRAEEMHRKSLLINKQLGWKSGIARDYGNLALVCKRRGDLDNAERMLKKSLEIAKQLGQKECMANSYANLGSVFASRNDQAKALENWTRGRDLFAEIGMPHMVQQIQEWMDGLSDETEE